jgi:membrane fusion protein, multidrug efflux system
VKPVSKPLIWTCIVGAALSAVAAPKVWPLLHASPAAAVAGNPRTQPVSGERSPLQVSTFTVQGQPFAESVVATGTLLAEESVELQAEASGKVALLNFREGARVAKGELLVKLSDADLQASLARSKYRRQRAQLRERRIAQLLKQGVARQEEYDIALSELDIQQAEVELIEANIQKTEVRAPFSGVVGLRYVSEGAIVNANTRVASLQRLDRLKVDFAIPEKYAARVPSGRAITFTVAGGEHSYTGEIYAFDPRIDTATRTVLIRALCPNPHGRLLPGAFARVELTLERLNDAFLVPAMAVVPGAAEKNVFVLVDGKAQRRAVETGTRLESNVHIVSGLRAGDVVITSGLQQLRPGEAVVRRDDTT